MDVEETGEFLLDMCMLCADVSLFLIEIQRASN